MAKELVDVKVVIEREGTDEVLAQRSLTVTSKMLDPHHRDSDKGVVDTVGMRVQGVFAAAYMEACPAPEPPEKGESEKPTDG
jgi:hypothetical protein